MEGGGEKRERSKSSEQGGSDGGEKRIKLEGTTTLVVAAEAAPEDDRDEFVALVNALGCQKRKVKDLLSEGKLWSGLKEDVSQDLAKKRALESFFDYCKGGMAPVQPVAHVAVDLAEAIRIICPNPPEDRFTKVAPLGPVDFFHRTVERKSQFLEVLTIWAKCRLMNAMTERIPMVVVPSAPGDGKTHLIWTLVSKERTDSELDSAIESFLTGEKAEAIGVSLPKVRESAEKIELNVQGRKDFVKVYKDSIRVTVTFNHETQPQSGEDGSSMVGMRMLYSHFCRGNWGEFYHEMKMAGHMHVDAQAALDLIRADIASHFPNENRAVTLAVDEVEMSGYGKDVMKSISSLLTKPENNVFPIMTHVSEQMVCDLESASQRPIWLIRTSAISGEGVKQLIGSRSAEEKKLLAQPSFVSLIKDCSGVPRFLQFVFDLAAQIVNKEQEERRSDSREVLLERLKTNPGVQRFAKHKDKLIEAMTFALGGVSLREEGKKKKSELQLNGFLHPLDGGEGVPPLLFEVLSEVRDESPLLAAVLEFLRYDMVGLIDEGRRFEEQVGSLFRILSVAQEDVRKRKHWFLEPEKRTMCSLLGRGHFRFVAEPIEVHFAIARELYANSYQKREVKFTYGAGFDEFDTGLYFPQLLNHKGFDLLLVDKLVEKANTKYFTAVECKFSKMDEKGAVSSRTSPADLAKKVCNTLKEYPCLATALLDNRLCFVFASFQAFSGNETVESMSGMILAELKGMAEKDLFNLKNEITKEHLVGCLVILRCSHLEALLTPTLKG